MPNQVPDPAAAAGHEAAGASDAGLQPTLEYLPTQRRKSLLLAAAAALFGLLIIDSIPDSLAWLARAWQTVLMLVTAGATAWLCGVLVRQASSQRAVVRLDASGISGAGLPRTLGWDELDDATLDRGHGPCMLRFLLKANPARPDRARFLDGRNPARPQISLHMLGPEQQDAVYFAIHARLGVLRHRAGAGVAASLLESRADAAFDDMLDRLTPTPWALYAVVTLNLLVWGMNVAAGLSPSRPLSPQLFAWGANSAAGVVLDGQWWRLLTATFLHGGIVHLAFNMLGLWESGKQLSRLLGNGQFLLVYLASALCGSVAGLHQAAQTSLSVGASGAIFGVLGALLAVSWHYRRQMPAQDRRRLWSGLGLFVAYSLLHGLGQQNVDNAAHVGGLVCGTLLGFVLLAPFDEASNMRRFGRASLAAAVGLAALGYGVLATPIPPHWASQLYAAQAALSTAAPRFQQVYRQLASDNARLRSGAITPMQFLQNAQRNLVPGCRDIVHLLAPLRAPLWEPAGRTSYLNRRMCETTARSVQLELALLRRDPRLPADAAQQLERLSRDMAQLTRLLGSGGLPLAAPEDATESATQERAALLSQLKAMAPAHDMRVPWWSLHQQARRLTQILGAPAFIDAEAPGPGLPRSLGWNVAGGQVRLNRDPGWNPLRPGLLRWSPAAAAP